MSQSEQFHETWAHLRDHARPVVPDDVYYLRELRADQPPSKAHVKRISRVRATVTVARPRPEPDRSRRQQLNQAVGLGNEIARMLGVVKPIVR